MMFQRERQRVVVETNLDERAGASLVDGKVVPRTRHARTRFVPVEIDIDVEGEAFLDLPEVGDPWEPLTVQARLERMAETQSRLPRIRPARVRSCMPDTVRERWKDAPKEELTDKALDDDDLGAANQVIDALTAGQRPVAWAIAERKSDRWLGRKQGVHHQTAAGRKQAMLKMLADHWNKLDWRPDAEDIRRARQLLNPQNN